MTRGGWRPNAGRKKGSGRWGEPTVALRVPRSRLQDVLKLIESPRYEGEATACCCQKDLKKEDAAKG